MSERLAIDESDVRKNAQHVAPFSNGTEGEAFTARWCGTCAHDDIDSGGAIGCPILDTVICHEVTPAEWEPWVDGGLSDRYRCTKYAPEDPQSADARN